MSGPYHSQSRMCVEEVKEVDLAQEVGQDLAQEVDQAQAQEVDQDLVQALEMGVWEWEIMEAAVMEEWEIMEAAVLEEWVIMAAVVMVWEVWGITEENKWICAMILFFSKNVIL